MNIFCRLFTTFRRF